MTTIHGPEFCRVFSDGSFVFHPQSVELPDWNSLPTFRINSRTRANLSRTLSSLREGASVKLFGGLHSSMLTPTTPRAVVEFW